MYMYVYSILVFRSKYFTEKDFLKKICVYNTNFVQQILNFDLQIVNLIYIRYMYCDKVLFRTYTSLSWDKHMVLLQTDTISILHHAKIYIVHVSYVLKNINDHRLIHENLLTWC